MLMDEDLASIVAADEEARAHVQMAQAAADARVNAVRAAIGTRRAQRVHELRAEAAREIREIEEQATRTIDDRVAARTAAIAIRRRLAEVCMETAARLYARIVIDGTTPRESA
jgi:hypothetical protein